MWRTAAYFGLKIGNIFKKVYPILIKTDGLLSNDDHGLEDIDNECIGI
ncbi:MAG: hypothetical protein S4CHLAM2_10720 [Chlamydiales bacterium]|nr:hypothetical protein [Chlamydiales bacterium]